MHARRAYVWATATKTEAESLRALMHVSGVSQVLSGLLNDMQRLHERFDQIEGDILGPDKISSSRAPQPALTVALIGPCSPLSVVML